MPLGYNSQMSENSITTIARHRVLSGKEDLFLIWVEKTKTACKSFTGYMDTKVSKPFEKHQNEYVTIFRFDNYLNLQTWLDSKERKSLLMELTPLIKGEFELSKITGIDFYFGANNKQLSLPAMTLITYLGLMPLVIFIPALFQKYLNHQGLYLAFTSTALIVVLMSYAVMPVLVKASHFLLRSFKK